MFHVCFTNVKSYRKLYEAMIVMSILFVFVSVLIPLVNLVFIYSQEAATSPYI